MKYLTALIAGLVVTFCSPEPGVLERVREAGELRVITRQGSSHYVDGLRGSTGFERDLAQRFAEDLGVGLRLVPAGSTREVYSALTNGRGELAAAGLVATPERKSEVRFGPTYQQVNQQVVYRAGSRRPRSPAGLLGRNLEVSADPNVIRNLAHARVEHPELSWQVNPSAGSAELLGLVRENLIDLTVAGSHEVALARRFYPELRVAFDLGEAQHLAWAFPLDTDDSLYIAAIHFFNRARRDGTLEQLLHRHYGHLARADYVGTRKLLLHVRQRLPQYLTHFTKAAEQYDLDWRLLAALGYQESRWDPDAVSPTGVRGIMMLTLRTAREMDVTDRLDPAQSIAGGSRYLARVKRRIPQRIPEPDRTWMALAAYNVGLGHLEDARRLTKSLGGDPDRWVDVRERLPLLTQKEWYRKTRYGYARGHEPVKYVRNIRRYYDVLVWLDDQDSPAAPKGPGALGVESQVF